MALASGAHSQYEACNFAASGRERQIERLKMSDMVIERDIPDGRSP
jgi:hypothetical protein